MLGDKDSLGHKDSGEESESSQAQAEHLDVENEKTAPRGLAEGEPSVGDGGVSLATDNLGFDLALK